MVQLVCPCLNIRVHGRGHMLELRDACTLNLPETCLRDNFFSSQVYDVLLDLGGVTKAQKSLCTSRCVDGWVVTSCIGCELDVYAKHLDDNDRVLVNCNIEKDPNRVSFLMESENYSSLFKLLLPEMNDNFVQNNFGADLRTSHDSFECGIKHIQHQVSGYLKDEQKAMEERIRVFIEQQHARYAALQQKVRRHKQAMVYLLLKRKELKKSLQNDSLVESGSPSSPLTPTHHSYDDSFSSSDSAHLQNTSSDFIMDTAPKLKGPVHPKRILRRMHSVNNPPRRPKQDWTVKQVSHSIDVGGVFDMEGFETSENGCLGHSDDDTDGSSLEDNVPLKKEDDQDKEQFSGSLPISVPAWSTYARYSIYEDEEEKAQPHKNPEELASSFLALAHSVHDGTEIFGDLPRRRLNTGELLKSRPI